MTQRTASLTAAPPPPRRPVICVEYHIPKCHRVAEKAFLTQGPNSSFRAGKSHRYPDTLVFLEATSGTRKGTGTGSIMIPVTQQCSPVMTSMGVFVRVGKGRKREIVLVRSEEKNRNLQRGGGKQLIFILSRVRQAGPTNLQGNQLTGIEQMKTRRGRGEEGGEKRSRHRAARRPKKKQRRNDQLRSCQGRCPGASCLRPGARKPVKA